MELLVIFAIYLMISKNKTTEAKKPDSPYELKYDRKKHSEMTLWQWEYTKRDHRRNAICKRFRKTDRLVRREQFMNKLKFWRNK